MENFKFYDDEHKNFYNENTKDKKLDVYNKSLIYLLGLTKETREHYSKIYNDVSKEIKFGAVNEGWQTGTSQAITKLAFNLFNGFTGLEDREGRQYSVENIFAYTEFAPYMYEAIKIRFRIEK